MSIDSPDSTSSETTVDDAQTTSSLADTEPTVMASEDSEPMDALSEQTDAPSEHADDDIDPNDPKYMDRYECRACGYIYEPLKGDDSSGIDAGVSFPEIYDSWKCPVCTAPKRQFSNIGPAGNPSGFKENLGYGLGVNVLTPGQKNILIFGSLLIGFFFFLSLYGLH